ncbi:MAG TPA: hypothetical protein VL051_03890 [Burkholderiaceae bacterium]|nr:hypothetical protein [Burkholderiaceae bacterium]
MNWRRIFGTCAAFLVCCMALAAGGAKAGHNGTLDATHSTPASRLNLSLPVAGGLEGGERVVPVAPAVPARSAFDAQIPHGYQASPICKNGVHSTSYQIVDGKMVYKCD